MLRLSLWNQQLTLLQIRRAPIQDISSSNHWFSGATVAVRFRKMYISGFFNIWNKSAKSVDSWCRFFKKTHLESILSQLPCQWWKSWPRKQKRHRTWEWRASHLLSLRWKPRHPWRCDVPCLGFKFLRQISHLNGSPPKKQGGQTTNSERCTAAKSAPVFFGEKHKQVHDRIYNIDSKCRKEWQVMIICGRVHEEIDTFQYINMYAIFIFRYVYIYIDNQWKKNKCKYHKGNT